MAVKGGTLFAMRVLMGGPLKTQPVTLMDASGTNDTASANNPFQAGFFTSKNSQSLRRPAQQKARLLPQFSAALKAGSLVK